MNRILAEGQKGWLKLKVTCSCSVSKSSSSAPMIWGPTRDKGLPTLDWESWGESGVREEKGRKKCTVRLLTWHSEPSFCSEKYHFYSPSKLSGNPRVFTQACPSWQLWDPLTNASPKMQALRNIKSDDSKPTASSTDTSMLSTWHTNGEMRFWKLRQMRGKILQKSS